jgi:hypothetical protein
MATLADYPQPAHPERVGVPRYQDLDSHQRSLRAMDAALELDLKDAKRFVFDWREARNKKLSFGDKMFHRSKWKELHVREGEILGALGTRFNKNKVTGCHYLVSFGWFEGDGNRHTY